MEKIKLQAAAKLIYQLGEQLIENELVALLELIKNSYDADATYSSVDVDTEVMTPYGKGKIVIEDNGHGMLPSILKNSFFKIATDFKEKNRESLNFKRQVLGEKGLGRLSFQRLGKYITVTTKADLDVFEKVGIMKKEDREAFEEYNASELKINWSDLNTEMDLTEVTANLSHFKSQNKNSFTRIEIEGIRNKEFWNLSKKNIKLLINEFYKMTSPFSDGEDDKGKPQRDVFKIFFSLNGVSYNNEEINEDVLEYLSDNKIKFSFKNSILKIDVNHTKKYINKLAEERIKKLDSFDLLESSIDYKKLQTFSIEINFKENVKPEFSKYFKLINPKFIDGEFANPGEFSGKLYNIRFNSENRNVISENIKSLELENIKDYNSFKNIWDSLQGFYIFRNGFRILPYGNKNFDWSGFDIYSLKTKYVPYQHKSMLGYINLDGPSCRRLREQTNRQGFILDEYGENFIKIIQHGIVTLIGDEVAKLIDGFGIKGTLESKDLTTKNGYLKFKKIEDPAKELEIGIKEIEEEVSNNNPKDPQNNDKENLTSNIVASNPVVPLKTNEKEDQHTSNARILAALKKVKRASKKKDDYHKQVISIQENIIEDVKGILPMVGQSILVEAMTHEFHRIKGNIKGYASKTIDHLKEGNVEKKQVFGWQNNILTETHFLETQLEHLEPTYKKNHKLIEKLNLKGLLKELYTSEAPMSRRAEKAKINVKITGESFTVQANKGYLITVFDNLFLNSLYWVNFSEKKEKIINIEVNENGEVIFYDNGPGISKEMENFLFQPFKTEKVDGRGLGLYISKVC